MNNISKEIWKEILDILNKYKISYTTHYEDRHIQNMTVVDKHIQINLVIPDYFKDDKEEIIL